MKLERKMKQRMRGNNLVLYILIMILIAIALFVGICYGYELGIKNANIHYSSFIKDNCMCFVPANQYENKLFQLPKSLNISIN